MKLSERLFELLLSIGFFFGCCCVGAVFYNMELDLFLFFPLTPLAQDTMVVLSLPPSCNGVEWADYVATGTATRFFGCALLYEESGWHGSLCPFSCPAPLCIHVVRSWILPADERVLAPFGFRYSFGAAAFRIRSL